jgi:hypothetical protein
MASVNSSAASNVVGVAAGRCVEQKEGGFQQGGWEPALACGLSQNSRVSRRQVCPRQ